MESFTEQVQIKFTGTGGKNKKKATTKKFERERKKGDEKEGEERNVKGDAGGRAADQGEKRKMEEGKGNKVGEEVASGDWFGPVSTTRRC